MKRPLCICLLFAALSLAAAQAPKSKTIAWIDPGNQYSTYLEAAVQKKHVPVAFTTKKAAAALLVQLDAKARNGSTWRAVLTGDSGRASALSMSVIDATTGVILFSYTCHKGGHSFSVGHHEGFQSAAECLAKHWGEYIKNQGK